jgi:cytochrome c oxidase cbb3-type subunit 3
MISSGRMKSIALLCAAAAAVGIGIAQSPAAGGQGAAKGAAKRAGRPPEQSPASLPRLKSETPQTYPAEQVRAGGLRFAAQCGFCHGRDGAGGGEGGTDLTRSKLVSEDTRGDRIGPFLREGRPGRGMPAFTLGGEELSAIVAFLHSQMDSFASLTGGRRSVEPEDLATGNAADGRAYFQGAGGCSGCHSAAGDLAGVGGRYQGLALIRRMLYPAGNPAPAPPKATFTLPSGQTLVAPVAAEDEFTVTILDPLGARQTYRRDAVKVKIENPMSAHFVQLGKYTDADMHNVYAYLTTLK